MLLKLNQYYAELYQQFQNQGTLADRAGAEILCDWLKNYAEAVCPSISTTPHVWTTLLPEKQ